MPTNPNQPDETIHHVSPRKRRGRPAPDMQLRMTSMIDVIFLLLIYFVVTASFVSDEGVLTTKLPEGESSETVTLDADQDTLWIELSAPDDDPYDLSITVDTVEMASFQDALAELITLQDDPANNRMGYFAPDAPVRIDAVGSVRWQYLFETMNTAIAAGYTNVSFAPESN